ncbi:MAG: hypothetical protein CSA58_06490 [Micrococcales bacterium]|nr:MAG: hypothetical protein CSA58_06490 [Micrococcales bacterium]
MPHLVTCVESSIQIVSGVQKRPGLGTGAVDRAVAPAPGPANVRPEHGAAHDQRPPLAHGIPD